jgi:Tfp pilus assembly protein PilN
MRTRLNLATAPLENQRRFVAGAALAGVVAVAALVGLSWSVYRASRENRQERMEIARLERHISELRQQRRELDAFFSAPATHEVMDRAAFLNSLIDQRSFPWTKMFMDLEQILPEGVRVVSIAPRMQSDGVQVTLVIGATSDEGKLKFLRALEKSPAFSRIEVKSETRPNRAGEADQVELELIAWYATS